MKPTRRQYNHPKPEFQKPKEETVVEEVKETVDEPVEEPEVELLAEVDGVNMSLNIRMVPKVEPNNQIGILGKGTKLFVLDNGKTVESDGEEWYKVRIGKKEDEDNIGYAMKKYIKMI